MDGVEVGFGETWASTGKCGVDLLSSTKYADVLGADGVEEIADAALGIRAHTSQR